MKNLTKSTKSEKRRDKEKNRKVVETKTRKQDSDHLLIKTKSKNALATSYENSLQLLVLFRSPIRNARFQPHVQKQLRL